jgi:hypothetical protein
MPCHARRGYSLLATIQQFCGKMMSPGKGEDLADLWHCMLAMVSGPGGFALAQACGGRAARHALRGAGGAPAVRGATINNSAIWRRILVRHPGTFAGACRDMCRRM